MTHILTATPIQYITDAEGERVAVVLPLEEFRSLQASRIVDPELLQGMSDEELHALAESMLSVHRQEHLTQLLEKNQSEDLSAEEEAELDKLLNLVDSMNLLKARAVYTLKLRAHPN